MPEGPEVQRVRMTLEPKIKGKKIVKSEIILEKIVKQQDLSVFLDRANGTIKDALRRGKYLIFPVVNENFKDDLYMIIHLGMTGAVFAVKSLDEIMPEFRKHVHAILTLNDGTLLTYCDIRRFGGIRIFTNEEYLNYASIQKMAPEPNEDDAEDEFIKRVKKKTFKMKKQEDGSKVREDIPIKEAILNQGNIAGVGNIYACESLAYAGVKPDTPVDILSDEQLREIFRLARDVMEFSISVGGSSISDYVDGEGRRGSMQNYLVSYGQQICGLCKQTEIIKSVVAGRGTYHCPSCQK